MRRLLSILVLLSFLLPVAAQAMTLGQDADAKLPACCRRGAKHGCAMGAGAARGEGWRAPLERCPYFPGIVAGAQHDGLAGLVASGDVRLVAMRGIAARVAAAECRYRVARESVRGKRGPPVVA